MFVSDSYTKHPLLFMNRESLLKTVALNKYVKCFLNKNAQNTCTDKRIRSSLIA